MILDVKYLEIVDVECPKCGCKTSQKEQTIEKYTGKVLSEFGSCTECGALTFHRQINESSCPAPVEKPVITCPYCGSTNTKKIGFGSKAVHTALFGIFAVGKVSKEWHCNNCKSDF